MLHLMQCKLYLHHWSWLAQAALVAACMRGPRMHDVVPGVAVHYYARAAANYVQYYWGIWGCLEVVTPIVDDDSHYHVG